MQPRLAPPAQDRSRRRSPRPRRTAVLAACAAVLGTTLTALAPHAAAQRSPQAAPEFREEVLYQGGTGGYSCYRIPAVVEAADGTLLAFAEGRVDSCSDKGDIDIVLRRSTDGGDTWTASQVVLSGDGDTRGNPAPVVDRESGRISLLSTHNPGADDTRRTPYLQHSTDNGRTWTPARSMAAELSRPEWDRWYATGPGHGLQLATGEHAGRLLVGGNHQGLDGRQGAHLVYSDDGGLNWKLGADDTRGTQPPDVKPQELSLFEREDGSVYAAARDERGTDPGNRAAAVSSDGGVTWDAPFEITPSLVSPVVQGATLRHGDEVLASLPAHPADRKVMSVRASHDDGRTWEPWQEGRVIHWGPTAYSDMVELAEDRVGLLYEAGTASPYETIRWARFNDAFLDQPQEDPPPQPAPAPGATTPDVSRSDNTAYVRGSSVLRPGRFGNSLYLDNADDHVDARVEVPWNDSLDVGDGDFTWTGWFKYGRTNGAHAIMWAYGVGGNAPSVWLRAEPERDRIIARMQMEQAAVSVQTTGAYNDNAFHFVTLQRAGGKLTLSVDGTAFAADAPPGSPTAGKEFGIGGIDIGQRLDGANRFHGYLDDMRVYDRALSPGELRGVRNGNADVPRGQRLRLPLDTVDPR
ncbi:sialidase family protein [Streptomyces synnematoformans]|uniref:exo-alpha-sialidase n=1 Tax=Streptomyces synnematoformans TaxID=415721 RepID=A0ABN2XS93_9ACTN